MDVWVVIDRYDHCDNIVTVHMTEKGAMLHTYGILLESYESICESGYGFDSEDGGLKEEYPDAYEFVKKYAGNIEEAKLADLTKHQLDLACFCGDGTDWATDVSIERTRLQA